MSIHAHPDNIKWLKERFTEVNEDRVVIPPDGYQFYYRGEELIANPYLPVFELTGKITLPGGMSEDPKRFTYRTRWVTYGPEDLDYLLYAGIATWERYRVFRCINMSSYKL